ncbi:putative tRNA pseudouridine synthase 4 [Triangularia verruculosa]|uniref:tRNA pseudouridine(55) synthase n=1 Tax=Triangularia verruculosa TaxID=2587418 RepID=A0AAN6XV60_9PEZI|nr:putative tRNA pseudouridine synthase 4 [Triangularia verruculosa]
MTFLRPQPFIKMATGKILEGVFAINKPIGISSAQVIRDCQNFFDPSAKFAPLLEQERQLRETESKYQKNRRRPIKRKIQTKIGHGGTLDPLAGGVLILGIGKGTKSLQQFLLCTKTYETVVVFGASTDTYDRLGKIIKKGDYSNLTRDAVEKALEPFRGKFRQMPPLYSSLKMAGKPLYEYAREGKPIPREIETREVEVSHLEMVEWYEPGTHKHYWPDEEAGQAEKNVAQSVWRVAKAQEDGGEGDAAKAAEEESKALKDFNSKKRAAEEAVDGLVSEETRAAKRVKNEEGNPEEPLMSGALDGKKEKRHKPPKGRGSDLVPVRPDDAPAPWEGKGPPAVKIRMTVTSGFYVRSLCHDLGEKLGCGAMMAELARTRQGQFTLGGANCLEYDDLLRGEEVWGPKVESMLDKWNARPGEIQEPTVENGGLKAESTPEVAKAEEAPAKEEEKCDEPMPEAKEEPMAAAA